VLGDLLRRVDPHFADAAFNDGREVRRIDQQEAPAQERMLPPGAAELLHVHAQTQIADRDAFYRRFGHDRINVQ
jgi:hypothetical protein